MYPRLCYQTAPVFHSFHFFFFQDLLICYYLFELIVAINKLN